MGDKSRLKRLTTRFKNPIKVEDYVRCLRLAGFTEEEAYADITEKVHQHGKDAILGSQLDIADKIYAEKWQFRIRRILIGKHTEEEWEEKKRQYSYRCIYCGARDRKLCKDHVIPVFLGGANTIDNIVPACKSCNSQKGTKPSEVFVEGGQIL